MLRDRLVVVYRCLENPRARVELLTNGGRLLLHFRLDAGDAGGRTPGDRREVSLTLKVSNHYEATIDIT
jgi:hypothetical protein